MIIFFTSETSIVHQNDLLEKRRRRSVNDRNCRSQECGPMLFKVRNHHAYSGKLFIIQSGFASIYQMKVNYYVRYWNNDRQIYFACLISGRDRSIAIESLKRASKPLRSHNFCFLSSWPTIGLAGNPCSPIPFLFLSNSMAVQLCQSFFPIP